MKINFTYRKLLRIWKRLGRKRQKTIGLIATALLICAIFIQGLRPTMINPTAYAPLLQVIAMGESNGNYNAYFGNASNVTLRFTDMTVAQVMDWQKRYVEQGSASNAVGRYQFMGTTLAGLVKQMRIDPNTRFDEALQDRLAIALIERRGAVAYVEQKISPEQFAENLSKEWAALPRTTGDRPQESYYAGDGLNVARVDTTELLRAISHLRSQQ